MITLSVFILTFVFNLYGRLSMLLPLAVLGLVLLAGAYLVLARRTDLFGVHMLSETIGHPTPMAVPFKPGLLLPKGDFLLPVTPQKWYFRQSVDYSVTANKAVEFVMVEDLKPAGFEAVMLRSGPEVCNYACAHAELRTDRVAMFMPELRVGTTKLSYELRAETPGKFAALPARAEAMYAPEIQATADEMRFEVRDAPTTGVATQ